MRKDRSSNKRGGGIAVYFNTSRVQFTKAKIPPTKHEVYAAIGRRMGQRRKIVILAVYIPPWYNSEQNRSLFRYTNDAILTLRAKYEDPYFIVAGDFNRRDFGLATSEYPDIKPIFNDPTRGDAVLDIIGSNMNDTLIDKGVTAAIHSDEGIDTDHLTVFSQFRMPRVPSYNIESYSYLHLDERGHAAFGEKLASADWGGLTDSCDVNEAVDKLQNFFKRALESCYELKFRKKKSSEPGWMTDWLRKDIEARRRVYKLDTKRTKRWKVLKRRVASRVKKRKRTHNEHIIQKFDNETNPGKFFHHLQCLTGNSVKQKWSPQSMFPGDNCKEIAEKLALFFNGISSQYEPLNNCLLYTSPSPRDRQKSRMPSSA